MSIKRSLICLTVLVPKNKTSRLWKPAIIHGKTQRRFRVGAGDGVESIARKLLEHVSFDDFTEMRFPEEARTRPMDEEEFSAESVVRKALEFAKGEVRACTFELLLHHGAPLIEQPDMATLICIRDPHAIFDNALHLLSSVSEC